MKRLLLCVVLITALTGCGNFSDAIRSDADSASYRIVKASENVFGGSAIDGGQTAESNDIANENQAVAPPVAIEDTAAIPNILPNQTVEENQTPESASGGEQTGEATATASNDADGAKEPTTEELSVPEPKRPEKIVQLKGKNVKPIVPAYLQIPSVKVDTEVIKVGLLKNGAMEAPKDDTVAGWFEPGYKPGMNGSSIMAGHVDNIEGPAVFFYLRWIKKGAEIHVMNEEGERLTFVVTDKVSYKTDEAPVEEIFGPSDVPRLILITCNGTYDKKTNSHEERLVVYSELKKS
jgi:sortase (surface protein transpeptidase)